MSTDSLTELRRRATDWIEADPDPDTAAELADLVRSCDSPDTGERKRAVAELQDRFSGPLEFGTAGLRGHLGAGEHRMNRAVVIRAAAGLQHYLADVLGPDHPPVVVIGYDARYGSHAFAQDTADVIAAAGGRALLLPEPLPTPVLAFALRHLQADAGVMVTASHNPPQDNGYKVYLGGRVVTDAGQGAQIVPPHDAEIARRIAEAPRAVDVPRGEERAGEAGGSTETVDATIVEDYLDRAVGTQPPPAEQAEVQIVYTPLHGVGGRLTTRALRAAGFTRVHLVAEQAEPDPDFPTTPFPNPEEPGALDLAIDAANHTDADLVIANDPDADRCSIAIPDEDSESTWRQLTGDEVGVLLGADIASHISPTDASSPHSFEHGSPVGTRLQSGSNAQTVFQRAEAGGGDHHRAVLANSIVSSRLLAAIAAAHGIEHHATLTGFKWISRVPGLAYGYEEALGYCTDPEAVRDKDGISAAVALARLAAQAKAAGGTLRSRLDELAIRYGVHHTAPVTIRVEDLARIGRLMDHLRQDPPTSLAGSAVVGTQDLNTPGEELPPTDALVFETESRDRVIVRPSGTEPKLKCYLEVIEPVAGPDRLAEAKETARQRMAALRADVSAALSLD